MTQQMWIGGVGAAVLTAAVGATTSAATPALTVVGQARSIAATASTTGGTGQNDSESDSSADPGPYAGSRTAGVNLTIPSPPGGPPGAPLTIGYSAGANVSQTSSVAGDALTGTGSVGASAFQNGSTGSTTAAATSAYSVQFTVATATALTLTGDLTGGAAYHLGPLEVITDGMTLSGSVDGTLYAASARNLVGQSLLNYTYDVPLSYEAVFLPGQTYTLSASAYVSSLRQATVGETSTQGATDGFTFALTGVPEPTAAGLLAAAVLPLVGRRRRRR